MLTYNIDVYFDCKVYFGGSMRLKNGDKLIDFEIEDFKGENIKLSDYKDKKILLSFYRYASCPLCNLRIHNLIQKYPDYKNKNLITFTFFESSKESISEYVGKQEPPFSLIPDPERKVYKLYGVEKSILKYILGLFNGKLFEAMFIRGFKIGRMENDKTIVPADFLIEDGIIKVAYYGKNISDHLSFKVIEDFLL